MNSPKALKVVALMVIAVWSSATSAWAQGVKELVFAHQDMLDPYRVLMARGNIEGATGYKIMWRKFAMI